MKYAFIYIFLVILVLAGVVNTINVNSMDNLITSVAPSVFELSSNILDDKDNDVDMVDLDQEKFINLLCEEIKNNKTFYQGDVLVEFYFYNAKTRGTCGGGVSCNGVQIKITFEAIYMLNRVKEYRYEVSSFV